MHMHMYGVVCGFSVGACMHACGCTIVTFMVKVAYCIHYILYNVYSDGVSVCLLFR